LGHIKKTQTCSPKFSFLKGKEFMARRKKSKSKKQNHPLKQQPIIIINEVPKNTQWAVLLVPVFNWLIEILKNYWN